MSDDKPDLTETEARQGDKHRTNLRVLVISVAILVVAFILAYWYNAAVTPTEDQASVPGAPTEESAPATGEDANEATQPMPTDENIEGADENAQ